MTEENSNMKNTERVEKTPNGKKAEKPNVPPKFKGTMEPEVKIVGEPKPKKEKSTAPRVSRTGSNITLLKELAADTKMPHQCKQIVGILSAAEGKMLTREKLVEEMAKVVVTRQPIDRIFAFYQSHLVSGGWVRIEPTVAPATPVTPAAAPQTEHTPEVPAEAAKA